MARLGRIGQHLVEEWAEELSLKLGRSAEQIRQNGLNAGDFPGTHELHLRLIDGSFVQFRFAFWVTSPDKPYIAVFTEHCGYHLFWRNETTVSEITSSHVYPSYE